MNGPVNHCLRICQEYSEIVKLLFYLKIGVLAYCINFQIIYRWKLHYYEYIYMRHEKQSGKLSGITIQYTTGSPTDLVQICEA